ncbi:MAG: adenosine kinase [Bacteroidales bacterium]|nr:adenosine kinase [Bacteroidales bacterium]MDD3700023.1 adenosine kinase [Bacteroidales bacterium]MDY0368795.1 adenosine kinase [Bacteroidales bacterium]
MKIIGLGNALVDILTRIDDEHILNVLQLPKGSMQLVDEKKSAQVQEAMASFTQQRASGGSASNTIHGLARLGLETAFIGHVGQDETAAFFERDMQQAGINPILFNSPTASGIAHAIISPDGERTFATYLGAAIELEAKHIQPELFDGYDMLYVEGYMVQNEELLLKAMQLAKNAGLQIAIDLASYNVVESNKDLLHHVIETYVDILFANEEEARAFTGAEPEAALNALSSLCNLCVVKLGAAGSLIHSANTVHRIGVFDATVVDTTGAGDLFAAGFLYGYVKGWPLTAAGQLGALLSARVIEVIGPKLNDQQWKDIREHMKRIEKQ